MIGYVRLPRSLTLSKGAAFSLSISLSMAASWKEITMQAPPPLSCCSGAYIGRDPIDGTWEWAWRERSPSPQRKIPSSAVSAS